jgi:hypothetical protein
MEVKGVSPVIATVLLIVVTVLLVSVVAVVAMGMVGKIVTPVFADLTVENYSAGQAENEFITIYFSTGDNLRDAFIPAQTENKVTLKNLVIRIDGKTPTSLILNGGEKKSDFEPGDYLQVQLPKPLSFGSVISIAWKPTGQTLRYVKVA